MTRREARQEIIAALATKGYQAMYIKGAFFIRSETGIAYLTFAGASKLAGIEAPHVERRARVSAYGDWATVAAMNGCLKER